MKDFLEFYKGKCAFKFILAIFGSMVAAYFLSHNSSDFIDILQSGFILSLPVCIGTMVWRPLANVLFTVFTPIMSVLTGLSGFFCLLIPIMYFIVYVGPFFLILLGVGYLIQLNVYIFGTLFLIISIANIILAIYYSATNLLGK